MANYQERREKMSTAKKTLSVITAVAIFAIAALMTMCVTQVASAAEMNGNTATELVSFIGTGWCLGNTLTLQAAETAFTAKHHGATLKLQRQ